MFSKFWSVVLVFAILIKGGQCGTFYAPCNADSDCGAATDNVACIEEKCDCPGGGRSFFHIVANYEFSEDDYVCQKQCNSDSDCNLANNETCVIESTQSQGLCECQDGYVYYGTPKCVPMYPFSTCPDGTSWTGYCDNDFGTPCFSPGTTVRTCQDNGVCCGNFPGK